MKVTLGRNRVLKALARSPIGAFAFKHGEAEEVVVLAITLNGAWAVAGPLLGAGIAAAAINAPAQIDLSNNNGARAAIAIAAPGVQVVEAKATEGLRFRDPDYGTFRAASARHHRAFGGYLFLHPTESGTAQALYFLAYARPHRGDIEPVVDSETGSPHAAARQTYAALHELTVKGYSPILYASSSYVAGLVAADPRIRQFRVWDAEYGPRLHTVAGVRYVAWQFTDRAHVSGFSIDGSRLLVRNVRSIEWKPRPIEKLAAPRPKSKPVASCKAHA